MSRDWLNLTWREKSWGERAQTVFANLLAGVVCLVMAAGVLFVVGRTIDVQDARREAQRACLRGASNGLEIARCR